MNLYLKVVDGAPVDHPHTEENLKYIYGENIPAEFKPFIRKPAENLLYKVAVSSSYREVDGVWQDVWDYRDMTDAEKTEYDFIVGVANNTNSGSAPDVI